MKKHNNWINLTIPFVMKIAHRYAQQFSRQSLRAGIAGYPNVMWSPSAPEEKCKFVIEYRTILKILENGIIGIYNPAKAV
jgi:hypothetical protein